MSQQTRADLQNKINTDLASASQIPASRLRSVLSNIIDSCHNILTEGVAAIAASLGNAATKNVGTTTGTVAAGDHLHTGVYDPAGTASSAVSTHVGLPDPHTQYALESGLGDSSMKNVGTAAGTVAAGDHLHTGVYDPAGTALSAVSTHVGLADPHTQYALESNLGDSSTKNVGTTTGTVAAGDDSRLSNARTPTAHAASHVNGTDDIQSATASQKGLATSAQITKLDGIEALADVTDAANVGSTISGVTEKTTPVDGDLVPLLDSANSNNLKKGSWANIKATLKTYFDGIYSTFNGAYSSLSGIPSTFAPSAHTHASSEITSGTLDGDRLPATSTTKKGGVPATGTPSGKYLKDDGTWAAVSGGGDVAGDTHAASSKTTPVDADELPLVDSAAIFGLKKLTWSDLKTTLKTYFDGIYSTFNGAYSSLSGIPSTFAPSAHTHASSEITSGTLDGDRLPVISTTKKGGVPATGTPSGKYLKDDGTWAAIPGGGDMLAANNLSDVSSASTAFGNIKQAATTSVSGVVELATSAETTAGLAVQASDSRLSDARTPTSHDHSGNKLAQANTHESPDTDTATTALHHTLGAGANQAAAGNHNHSGIYQPASSALSSAQAAATPSIRALGTGSTDACAGNDSRLSDARTPSAHKTSHATGGSDALTAADVGAAASSKFIAGAGALTGPASPLTIGTAAGSAVGDFQAASSTLSSAQVQGTASIRAIGTTNPESLGAAAAGSSTEASAKDHVHPAPSGTFSWTKKTTTYTAVRGDRLLADTTSAAFTITLPATPSEGDIIQIADFAETWGTNALTVGRNGAKIDSAAEDLICDRSAEVTLTYINATIGWQVRVTSVTEIADASITPAKLTTAAKTGPITFGYDGGATAVATGTFAYIPAVPFACTITGWAVMGRGTGLTLAFDIYRVASGGTSLPSASIVGAGTKPGLSTGNKTGITTPTSWTSLSLAAGDSLACDLVTNTGGATMVVLQLFYTRD
jgi:hypothetical protein